MSCSIDTALQDVSKRNRKSNPNTQTYDKTLFDLQSLVAHELDKVPAGKLLDAGCAYGTMSGYLKEAGWDVYALDAMASLSSKKWWDKQGIEFAEVNLEINDVPWGEFDFILFTEVIEHLNYNPVPVIERLYKALKPGGRIICTTPMKELQGIIHPIEGRYRHYLHYRDIPLPWNGYKFDDDHHYFYARNELAQLFHEVGFQVQQTYTIRKGTTHYLQARKPL